MIKWLCNYLKECGCRHDYELVKEITEYATSISTMPSSYINVYMCRKCGHVKKVRM